MAIACGHHELHDAVVLGLQTVVTTAFSFVLWLSEIYRYVTM
jgi:hypothetical protein